MNKPFYWEGGASKTIEGENYDAPGQPGTIPVEVQMRNAQTFIIIGWNGLTLAARTRIIAKLTALGWKEGEQSKPDEGPVI